MIGLVGGIGSGKSLVAEMLAELGCRVINADAVGHELLGRPEVVGALVEAFGEGILGADGAISRPALADRAFADEAAVARLNGIVHPRLRAELVRRIEDVRGGGAVVVLDAALLLDTDWHELCDEIVFVDSPLDQRRRRVEASRGWSAEELSRRENLQKSLDFKRNRSDHVIGNNSSVSHLRQQVRLFYQRLVDSDEDTTS